MSHMPIFLIIDENGVMDPVQYTPQAYAEKLADIRAKANPGKEYLVVKLLTKLVSGETHIERFDDISDGSEQLVKETIHSMNDEPPHDKEFLGITTRDDWFVVKWSEQLQEFIETVEGAGFGGECRDDKFPWARLIGWQELPHKLNQD